MKELVLHIARSLVDDPDAVRIDESVQEKTTVLALTVAKGDFGKVIGKQGRTVRAIRYLLASSAGRAAADIRLEIVE
jgi:predicted RNA-binding protein YlqC (UPF0109 family)